MTPERWQLVKRLFQEARDLEASERPVFLDKACAGDDALRREVESYLEAHEQAGTFLKDPALEVEAGNLAKDQAAQGDPLATNAKLPPNASTLLDTDEYQANNQPIHLVPGKLLGERYLIEEVLGSGGFNIVFRASDKKLNGAPVAIKVLHERLHKRDDRDKFERMFRDEIEALTRIDHRGVVRASDVGQTDDGRPYLVMQYVSGESLRSVLQSHRLPLERSDNLIREIGSALTAIHAQGVIHRDLTPENIILHTEGNEEYVKLIDFGIAKVLDSAGEAGIKTTMIAGKPLYMAPEQLKGKPAPASDIYALGVIAYEMVTGQLPFKAESQVELRDMQRAGVKVKPCDLRPDLPKTKEAVILKALSFKQSDRYASARNFSEAFTTGKRPPRRWIVAAVAVLMALVIVLGVAWWRLGGGPIPPERTLTYWLTIERDGKTIPVNGRDPFKTGDAYFFNATPAQEGALYLFNEGTSQKWNVLFPTRENNQWNPRLAALQTIKTNRYVFTNESGTEMGTEKIWLVWAAQPVPLLDSIIGKANNKLIVDDLSQKAALRQFMSEHGTPEVISEGEKIALKQRNEVLVYLLKLEHRNRK